MIKLTKYVVRRSKYCHMDLFLKKNKSILKKYICVDKKNILFFSLSSLKKFQRKQKQKQKLPFNKWQKRVTKFSMRNKKNSKIVNSVRKKEDLTYYYQKQKDKARLKILDKFGSKVERILKNNKIRTKIRKRKNTLSFLKPVKLRIKKRKLVKLQLKKNFRLDFSYYSFVREFGSFKIAHAVNSTNSFDLSTFWFSFSNKFRYRKEQFQQNQWWYRRWFRRKYFDKFRRRWRAKKGSGRRSIYRYRRYGIIRIFARYRLSFYWIDFCKLQNINIFFSNTFSNWRYSIPEKLYWTSFLLGSRSSKPFLISKTKSDNLLSLFLLKLSYSFKHYLFLFKDTKNNHFVYKKNKNLTSLLYLHSWSLFTKYSTNLSLFYIYLLRKNILNYKTYNRLYFDKYLFFQRTVFNRKRSPYYMYKRRNASHFFSFVRHQKKAPGYFLGLINHTLCFLYRKFIFKFLLYSVNFNVLLWSSLMQTKKNVIEYVYFLKRAKRSLFLGKGSFFVNEYQKFYESGLLQQYKIRNLNLLWFSGTSGRIFENAVFFRQMLSFWLTKRSSGHVKHVSSINKKRVVIKSDKFYIGREFSGFFLKEPRIPSFFFVNKNYNTGIIIDWPDINKNFYYYKFSNRFLYGSLKFFKY